MLKVRITILAAIMIFTCSYGVMAQTAKDTVYVFIEDQPDGDYFLPPPPDTASVAFHDDLLQWLWGKSVRSTERGQQASRESQWLSISMLEMATEVLELDTISKEATPALFRLITKSYNTGTLATRNVKKKYMRKRPFVQMGEHLWSYYDAIDEDFYRTNGSYPSGHTSYGWATALVLAEMWPELQDTILRRGYQYGESRVIGGPHWQSDVTAGYLCGAASVARAHANGNLLAKDIAAARAEYAKLKGLPKNYNPTANTGILHGEKILATPVNTNSYRYSSDVLRYYSAKELRHTERGRQAVKEAKINAEMMYQIFGDAMNITISEEETPAICVLIQKIKEKSAETVDRLQEIQFRKRPFLQFNESSFLSDDGEQDCDKSSYPSHYACLGWAEALSMAEVAPDNQNEILRRGYEYGYNRLIVGYSWYTDIEASRQLACGIVAQLHADAEYREMIRKARAEYERLKTK